MAKASTKTITQDARPKEFVQGAPCSGCLLYDWDGESPFMDVGVVWRAKAAGEGWSISFGGFAELMKFLEEALGTVSSVAVEAYREGEEELGSRAIHKAISQATFERFAQPLGGYLIRTGDANQIHAPVYYAFPYLPHEHIALSNLEPTEERTEQIAWMRLEWRPMIADMTLVEAREHVRLVYRDSLVPWSQFFHAHERLCAFTSLAHHAARKRLWNDRRGA